MLKDKLKKKNFKKEYKNLTLVHKSNSRIDCEVGITLYKIN